MDVGEESDAAEKCLQQIKKLPLIMDLLQQEKPLAKELQDSFVTLSQVIQQVADGFPEHNAAISDVMQRILNVHIAHVYRALNSCSPSGLIMAGLNLLLAMVTYSQKTAREVMATVNFQHGSFVTLVNRTDVKVDDDIRSCCLRLAMAFFVGEDNRVIKQMLTNQDFLKSFFKKLRQDRASNIKLLLVTLTQHLVCNPAVSKTEKLHILNNYTLQQVATLYKWKGTADDKAQAPSDDDALFQTLEIRQLCHQFLLKVTCDLKHGINFFDSHLGLSGKNCNPVLLKFLLGLPSVTEDEMIQALVVNILQVCPDLLNPFLSACKLSYQPRPSTPWLMNMKFLKEVLSGQSAVPSALQQRKVPASQTAHLAMTTTVPTVLTPTLLSQAVKHSSPAVSQSVLDIIKLIVRRACDMMAFLRETQQSAALSQYQQALLKVLPDVDTYVNLIHKVLGRPQHAEQAQQAVESGQPAQAGCLSTNADQADQVAEILPLVFEVLCAYQRSIPQAFAQTLYDFSRLPHLIRGAESLAQFPTAQRAFTLLLAFPEGKLRGFKEVKGDDGSTVLLLLKQLTSASVKSDLQMLKIQLLHKLLRETGLFAQTEWEIAAWLEGLAAFGRGGENRVVASFYRALTQAIRNPYPFNDHIFDAMAAASALSQQGDDPMDTGGSASSHDNAVAAEAQTFDLTGGDLEATSEEGPASASTEVEPLPCSALLPSALQILTQLGAPDLEHFGQYLSSVALSILDAQENPVTMCLLLRRLSQSEGNCLSQDPSWLYVLKYSAVWLPGYPHSDKDKSDVPLSYKDTDEAKWAWTSVLHGSILQGTALSDDDMSTLLQCDQKSLLRVARQLLMYVNTVHSIHPKKVGTVLTSYLQMLEKIVGHAGSRHRDKDGSQDTADDGDSALSGPADGATREWWTDVAALILKHAAFASWLGSGVAHRTNASPRVRALTLAVASCFHRCLDAFKLHLPGSTLHPLLEPIVRTAFQHFFSLLAGRRAKTGGGEAKTTGGDHSFRAAAQLVEELCVYADGVQLSEAAVSLLGVLTDRSVAGTASSKKQLQGLRATLCRLLEVVAKRLTDSRQQPDQTGDPHARKMSTGDMATLAELAHRFNCDRMVRILSQLLEDDHRHTSLITDAVFTAWLEDPTEAKCSLLSLLVKSSEHHQAVFEDWCQRRPAQRLRDTRSPLLPVVHSYFSSSSAPNQGKKTFDILYAAYWSWLEMWILHYEESDGPVESDRTKLSVMTHLLKHSTDKAVCGYLRKCISIDKGKGSAPFNRFLLETWQVAVEKLAGYELEAATQDVLQGVVVACLRGFTQLVKASPGDAGSKVEDHLPAITAIVKTVEAKSLRVSAPLVQAWKSLVRNGLKHRFESAALLRLLASLVRVIYRAPRRNGTGGGEEPDPEGDAAKNLLPLVILYQILLSHSLFLPTVLQQPTADGCPIKESLVKLMLTIVEREPLSCKEGHFAVLVGGYHATMSVADSVILSLMQQYQLNQAVPANYKLTAWGQAAVVQYQTQKALGTTLWQQPSMKEVLQQLDTDSLREAALQFPLHRKLQTPYDPKADGASSQLYDPCFLLPLFSQLLATECVVECQQFMESNALALTLAGLSSCDSGMRRAAYHVLASFLEHLEGARFRGRREAYYLLQCLKNSIGEPNMRLPCVLNVFVSRAARLTLSPESFMYPTVLQYLLLKPRLQTDVVPMFSRLFYSSSFKHEEECAWMLSLLCDGLREPSDVLLYESSSIFTTLLACHQSVLASKQTKVAMRSLFQKALKVEQRRESVARQLLPSLRAVRDICFGATPT